MFNQILKAALIFGVGTLAVKFVAFLKEILVAQHFGLSGNLDAFFLAYSIIVFFHAVIAGALRTSFIPIITKEFNTGDFNSARKLFQSSLLFTLIVAGIIALALYVFAPNIVKIVSYGFSAEKQAITIQLFVVLIPYYFFATCNVLFHSLLQSGKRFFISGITPMITPGFVIFVLVIFIEKTELGVNLLALGAGIGALAESLVLMYILAKKGFVALPRITNFIEQVRLLAGKTLVMSIGTMFMAATALVDQSMVSSLAEGNVAALNYGNRVPLLVNSLVTMAISVAILPYFSDLVAKKDWVSCITLLYKSSYVCVVAIVPLLVILYYFSLEITSLIFERGEFDASAASLVSSVQVAYLLHILPFLISIFWVRMLNALGENGIVSFIALVNFLFNIVFNYWFMSIWGVQGIAYATGVVYCFSLILCVIFAKRALGTLIV